MCEYRSVIEGLENGNIGYYAVDAYENERGVFFYDHFGKELKADILKKLLIIPNVLITPSTLLLRKRH